MMPCEDGNSMTIDGAVAVSRTPTITRLNNLFSEDPYIITGAPSEVLFDQAFLVFIFHRELSFSGLRLALGETA